MGRILTVGPNRAVVVSGSGGRRKKKIVSGGWAFAPCLISDIQYLPLELMALNPKCSDVETLEGVPVNVSGIAQCKIMNSPTFLLLAAEQFLGREVYEIKSSILQTIEGHLRAILGTLTVEDIVKDREKFAMLVFEVASPDVAKMGIQVVSFVIKEIEDNVGYLKSLGKTRTAAVKRDAAIGVAIADRDAGIREAECDREADNLRYEMLSKIENHSRLYFLKKTGFDKEVNSAKAEAQLAYQLEEAKLRQDIRLEEINIDIIERKKAIEIEQKEVERKERELISTVKLPSEAESYQMQIIAEGKKTSIIENAVGESEKIKLIGQAEANFTRLIGMMEAKKMSKRAIAYQSYGDIAISHLILQKLPEIAAKVSAPLAKIDEIVLLGGNCAKIKKVEKKS